MTPGANANGHEIQCSVNDAKKLILNIFKHQLDNGLKNRIRRRKILEFVYHLNIQKILEHIHFWCEVTSKFSKFTDRYDISGFVKEMCATCTLFCGEEPSQSVIN